MDEETFAFGSFRLVPAQRVLLEDDRPLRLGSRAFDILRALVESAGETIGKDQLIAAAWPDTIVTEGALRVHVAALRRALGDGRAGRRFIGNDPGRGYTFVAPVTRERPHRTGAAPAVANGTDLPVPLTAIVGRDDIIAALSTQLARHRLLSIVGPGGIGKTTVAIAVAAALRPASDDGVGFVALASLPDPDLVPSAVGTALGISLSGANPILSLAASLRDRSMLIVLDSCEHVIDAAARLAETVLKAAPQIRILVTSREPLRAEGEWLHRLPSLELPPPSGDISASEALKYPAVRLFHERAMAAVDGFVVDDANAAAVSEICRRLDGVPLALELAAARTDVFGVRELAAHLDDRFLILTSGRRTALPRHQTLGATLDWSYQLLSEAERTVLRRIGVFTGDFPLAAALAVAAEGGSAEVVDLIGSLVAKSLIAADLRSQVPRYRMLDTTRLYAFEKLKDSGELQPVARRHAECYRAFFGPAEAELETRPRSEWLEVYAPQINNLRAALDWAFGVGGDPAIGVALAVAAVPLWVQLSLIGECRSRVERALAALDGDAAEGLRSRMKLSAALGWSLMYGVGAARETGAAWTTTLQLARQLGDTGYQLRGLWGLWIDDLNNGKFRTALELAGQFAALVRNSADAIDLMMADRMLATSLHYLGDQGRARHHIDRMLGRYEAAARQPQTARFQFDQRITAHYFQARILWLQGFADRAMKIAESNIDDARSIGDALSLGSVLGQGACPIALFTGNFAAAERFGTMLLNHADRYGLRLWHAWACCYNALVALRRDATATGLGVLRRELSEAGGSKVLPRYLFFFGELAACLGQAGEVERGLETVDETLERCERNDERWYFAELLRIKGELLLLLREADAAEENFRRALHCAREQSALSWELRAANSLARLLRNEHRAAEGRDVLCGVFGRFTEGFETADLQDAKHLLAQLT
jgi:predicted ATPase/DNA-binding winged helix-turn-helix (wHTH) protein